MELNALGFPMREGMEVCNHFKRTGTCKFGPSCKFDHPEPDSLRSPPGMSSADGNGSSPTDRNSSSATGRSSTTTDRNSSSTTTGRSSSGRGSVQLS